MNLNKYRMNLCYAYRPQKPLLTFRLISTYVRIFLLRARPLRYVDFYITEKCNLACRHCFATAFKARHGKRMGLEDYRRVAREANELGAVNFSFQGGEPLMHPDLEGIIRAVSPFKNVISVTTNGILLTEKRAARLKRAGVDIFTISLDSYDSKEHDAFRNKNGAFESSMRGVKAAIEAGCHVTIGTTLSHHNIKSAGLERLLEWASDKELILCFSLAVPIGRWVGHDDVLLTPSDQVHLRSLIRKYPYVRTDLDANYHRRGCGAVKEILYITLHGDVLPCPYIHISLGNVHEQRLAEIRDLALKNRYFAEYWPRCLCATDREFIDGVLSRIYEQEDVPIKSNLIFPRPDTRPPFDM